MKIKTALPKDESDGLSHLEARLVRSPKSHIVALVVLDVAGVYTTPEGSSSVETKLRRIEAILPEDREEATKFIRRAYESRTGNTTLPIELENDLEAALQVNGLYEPLEDAPVDVSEPRHHPDDEGPSEVVIDVPAGGYGTMTIPLLIALLKKRGLDATAGKKMELIERLEANDADPNASLPPSNVTNLFNDGTSFEATEEAPPLDDEPTPDPAGSLTAELPDEDTADARYAEDEAERLGWQQAPDEPFEQPKSFFHRPAEDE